MTEDRLFRLIEAVAPRIVRSPSLYPTWIVHLASEVSAAITDMRTRERLAVRRKWSGDNQCDCADIERPHVFRDHGEGIVGRTQYGWVAER